MAASNTPAPASPALTTFGLHRDTVLLHWMVVLLFVLALTGVLGRNALTAGDPLRPLLRSLHILAGQVIFVFALLRAWVRWRHPLPTTAATTPAARLSRWAANGVHGLLYVVMFAQPITGVLFLQAGDKTVAFFGLALPMLVPSSPALHFQIKEFHQFIGNSFYALITMHVAGALWHHLVLKDHTLRRMLTLRAAAAGPAATPPAITSAATLGDELPPALRRRMVERVLAGRSPAQVAAAFGCPAQMVSQWVAQAAGEHAPAPSPLQPTVHSAVRAAVHAAAHHATHPAHPPALATAPRTPAPAVEFSNTPTDRSN